MGYEIDFLPVGSGQRSGDAICVRFGDLHGAREEQFVMVIDGGTKDSGTKLVEHIKKYYSTDRVDLVVSTHPDADHASGLTVVLDKLTVDRLWMHLPWEHAEDIRSLFHDGRITDTSLRDSIKRSLQNAHDLYDIACKKGIPVEEPFSNSELPFEDQGIHIVGPSETFYEKLLPGFRGTPEAKKELGFGQKAFRKVEDAFHWVAEKFGIETLKDPKPFATSAENNSSAIILLNLDNQLALLTGDAGVEALGEAANWAEQSGFHLPSLKFIQIPHHGSRRNVGPTILDRVLGPKGQQPHDAKVAYVSAAPDGAPKHPSKKVTNAFQRRGAMQKVFATTGTAIYHYRNAPSRGWQKATSLPFYDQVEEAIESKTADAHN